MKHPVRILCHGSALQCVFLAAGLFDEERKHIKHEQCRVYTHMRSKRVCVCVVVRLV